MTSNEVHPAGLSTGSTTLSQLPGNSSVARRITSGEEITTGRYCDSAGKRPEVETTVFKIHGEPVLHGFDQTDPLDVVPSPVTRRERDAAQGSSAPDGESARPARYAAPVEGSRAA